MSWKRKLRIAAGCAAIVAAIVVLAACERGIQAEVVALRVVGAMVAA